MMPIKEPSNDQNIERVFAKMSEECTSQNNNTKLTDCVDTINNFLNNIDNTDNNSGKDNLNLPYDHMYASNSADDGVDLNPADPGCQNTESEVRHLKDWVFLHLDLVQQQNDEILNKDKIIYNLRQENEMLKERLNCLNRGLTFPSSTFYNHSSQEEYSCEETVEEMTQDAGHIEEDSKSNVYFIEPHNNSSHLDNCTDLSAYEVGLEDSSSQDKEVITENRNDSSSENRISINNCDKDLDIYVKKEEAKANNKKVKSINDTFNNSRNNLNETITTANNSILSLNNSNFMINNSVEDSLKGLRMSIRRKRLCSSSSALSNNENSLEEPRSSRKRKKRKGLMKDEKILTSNEQYVALSSEACLGIPAEAELTNEIAQANNLEVPRWRVKVYTSCYAMEGTENLDDEVYNKRHMRLENDERRRKRWDVQRIREQRMVEKLKQRQERVGSGSKSDYHSDPVQSLWPSIEDIKYLEIGDQLPVSAFGAPVPRFNPSEFNLPWLNNPHTSFKKTTNRKSTIRRKATKR